MKITVDINVEEFKRLVSSDDKPTQTDILDTIIKTLENHIQSINDSNNFLSK